MRLVETNPQAFSVAASVQRYQEQEDPIEEYRGPRGGKGWRNLRTGEITYGERPPSAKETEETTGKAKTGGGAEEPEPEAPAQPQEDPADLAPAYNELPDDTTVNGWKKITPAGSEVPVWAKEDQAISTKQLIEHLGENAAPILKSLKPKNGQRQSGNGKSDKPKGLSDEEKQVVGEVAKMFGIPAGDVRNDRRLRNFLNRTARHLGFDPETAGENPAEQAIASAKFLGQHKPHLDAVVDMAKGYGWKGGTGKELAGKARSASQHLVRTAEKKGFDPSGDEDKDIVGAIQHIRNTEQQGQGGDSSGIQDVVSQVLKGLAKKPKKITPAHLAGAVLGFAGIYKMLRG